MAISTYRHPHDGGSSAEAVTCRVVSSLDAGHQAGAVVVGPSMGIAVDRGCDACKHCSDVCNNESCVACKDKAWRTRKGNVCGGEASYTMCEIRRHNTVESAWLIAGGYVYDATTYIQMHPGGETSILRKCGGVVDCTQDLNFHSRNGQKLWKKYRIGKVKKCCPDDGKDWWMFWK